MPCRSVLRNIFVVLPTFLRHPHPHPLGLTAGCWPHDYRLVATTFGNWSAVLAVPDPPPATTAKGKASHHYARAVALWAQGNVQAGDAEASQCRMLMTKPAGSPCDGRGDDCKGLRVAFDQELAAVRAWRVEKNATKAIAA